MQSTTKWFWATLALGMGVAVWLWRSAQARETASQALNTARTTLRNTESLSPVRDAVSKATDALKPAIDQVKDATSKATDALKPATDQAKDAASKVGNALEPAVDQVKDATSKAGDALESATDQVKDAASKVGDALEPAVDQVKDATSKATDALESATETPTSHADGLAPHDEEIAGVLDLDGENLTITQRVLSNIGHEATLNGVPHINVNTEDVGVVFLRGIVFTQEQREFAELVAATTEGVQSVVNELNVEQSPASDQQPTAASQPASTLGSQEPDDEDVAGMLDLDGENLTITQRVLSHFGHERVLADTPHINVNTQERGVVYLRGVVSTEEQSRVAQDIAAKVEGVQSVVNELNVE